MIRAFHRWPGLFALALVTVLALSGAALSVFPAAERLGAPQAEKGLSVAELATRIQAAYPGVEQIRRGPSGPRLSCTGPVHSRFLAHLEGCRLDAAPVRAKEYPDALT